MQQPSSYSDLSQLSEQHLNDMDASLENAIQQDLYPSIASHPEALAQAPSYASVPPAMPVQPIAQAPTPEKRVPQLSLDHLNGEAAMANDTEYTSNVKTLIKLVNELPEGVTKQTGAQIIRLTMEAMGIAMEEVLSEAQNAQSDMLDAVRGNIKKIEEYKTVIRKLESDIKYYQGKANELSEIIDLFILSNSSKQHSAE